jgi:1-acylglycerone phosphate reductase
MEGLEALGIQTLRLDVTKRESIQEAVNAVHEVEGRIDILVNNAGMSCTTPLLDQDLVIARQVYDTNVWGPLAVCQVVLPRMMERRSGLIVNIGSIVGHCATPWSGVYSSSKSALHAWSNAMRVELRPYGVKLTLVYPGGIQSNIAKNAATRSEWNNDSLYTPFKDSVLRRLNMSQESGSTPTDKFCRHVVSRILRKSPPREIYYGRRSTQFWILSFLPAFVKVSMPPNTTYYSS